MEKLTAQILLNNSVEEIIALIDPPLRSVADDDGIERLEFRVRNITEEYVLNAACHYGRLDVVRYLLDQGISPDAFFKATPIMSTIMGIKRRGISDEYIQIFNLLIERGADINKKVDHANPIGYAINNKLYEIVDILLANGVDLKTPCIKASSLNLGNSLFPIHIACVRRDLELFKKLLEHGADINQLDNKGCSVVDYAVYYEHLEMLPLIKEKTDNFGELVNSKNHVGNTPLHFCKEPNEIFHFLVKNGADINASNENEETVLYLALSNGNIELAASLINKGALIREIDLENCVLDVGKLLEEITNEEAQKFIREYFENHICHEITIDEFELEDECTD